MLTSFFRKILTFFISHVLKLKYVMKRMTHAKVDSCHLNSHAKRLKELISHQAIRILYHAYFQSRMQCAVIF
jgi:hypothetical protein